MIVDKNNVLYGHPAQTIRTRLLNVSEADKINETHFEKDR